ncbi:MAG: prolipoprotein diacylglyceryl transferase [Streptosporangiales bacterium]|nr:prolipoprotein diacylglyceryl transferase [Streptosporangiales bacterium]
MTTILASLPSPPDGVWNVGPVPIRAYALAIILGIVVAIWVIEHRWVARGGPPGMVFDVATWAVLFGLVGARIYHVITDWQLYFGEGRDPLDALMVWKGGLGIWGAIALGAVGAWIACRRRGVPFLAFADAAAPGIVLAQAIGRWGNWFNQELYGRPTTLPWGLHIDPANRPPDLLDVATYHPTFLYESLWCVGVAVLVIWADRRFQLGHGRAFALYVAAYTIGRAWIEYLRIDPAHYILGLRLNDWVALLVFLGAVTYLFLTRHEGREEIGQPPPDESASEKSDEEDEEEVTT